MNSFLLIVIAFASLFAGINADCTIGGTFFVDNGCQGSNACGIPGTNLNPDSGIVCFPLGPSVSFGFVCNANSILSYQRCQSTNCTSCSPAVLGQCEENLNGNGFDSAIFQAQACAVGCDDTCENVGVNGVCHLCGNNCTYYPCNDLPECFSCSSSNSQISSRDCGGSIESCSDGGNLQVPIWLGIVLAAYWKLM